MPKKKAAKAKSKAKSKGRKMPKFFPIDDEMKELSAMLEKEVSAWPGVSKKPMFGHQGVLRNGMMFAALPRTRAIKSPRSLMLKFASISPGVRDAAEKDSRVGLSPMRSAGWFTFELSEPAATSAALEWLSRAYQAAKK